MHSYQQLQQPQSRALMAAFRLYGQWSCWWWWPLVSQTIVQQLLSASNVTRDFSFFHFPLSSACVLCLTLTESVCLSVSNRAVVVVVVNWQLVHWCAAGHQKWLPCNWECLTQRGRRERERVHSPIVSTQQSGQCTQHSTERDCCLCCWSSP